MSNLIFHRFEQGSDEWKEYRRSRIGASDAAAIMSLDPWCTPLMKWNEKLSGEEKQETEDMRRGKELEPHVRRMVNEQYYRTYKPVVVENLKYNFGFASLDGWDADADIPILEIKCPRKHHQIIPDHYVIQLQWQMMITEAKEALFVSYDGEEVVELIVKRDDLLIEKLEVAGRAFFSLMVNFEPPPTSDKDYIRIDDCRAKQAAKDYADVCKKISDMEAIKEILREELIGFCKDQCSLIGDVRLTKTMRRGNIQYKNIPVLQGMDLEPYRSAPVKQWRIS